MLHRQCCKELNNFYILLYLSLLVLLLVLSPILTNHYRCHVSKNSTKLNGNEKTQLKLQGMACIQNIDSRNSRLLAFTVFMSKMVGRGGEVLYLFS